MTPLALFGENYSSVQEYTASVLFKENETGTRCYSVQNGIITAKFPFLNNLIAETTQANALAGMLGRERISTSNVIFNTNTDRKLTGLYRSHKE